jgi:hypothetical protein
VGVSGLSQASRSGSPPSNDRAGILIVAGICALLILAGFVCAIIALIGFGRTRGRGILPSAIVGLVLNSGLALLVASSLIFISHIARDRAAAAQNNQAQLAKAEKEGVDAAFSTGWYGAATFPNGEIVCITQVPDDSPLVVDMMKHLPHPCHMAILSVRNPPAGTAMSVDPADITFHTDGGRVIRTMNRRLIADATSERQGVARLLGPRDIPVGTDLKDSIICLPVDAQPEHVRTATVPFSTGDVKVIGRVYTTEEKKALFQQGEALKRQQHVQDEQSQPQQQSNDQQLRLQ